MICKNCGAIIGNDAGPCPECGKDPNIKQKKRGPNLSVRVLVLALVILLAAALSYYLYWDAQLKRAQLSNVLASTSTALPSLTSTSIPSSSSETQTAFTGEDYYVFVTPSGSKYHLIGCPSLGEGASQLLRSEAAASGYEPCAVCKADSGPPEKGGEQSSSKPSEESSGNEAATQTTTERRILSPYDTVYITPSGSKYHLRDCETISGSNVSAVPVRTAVSKGYEECSVCLAGSYNGPTDPQTTSAPSTKASTTSQAGSATSTKVQTTTSTASTAKATQSQPQTTKSEYIYYIAAGKYYHNKGCPELNGYEPVAVSEDEIRQNGYLPCPECIK